MRSKHIELLAPARDLATGRVAVDAGADAVYIGGPGFGARRSAGNPVEDVASLVRYARPFGARVYATLNTLLFDDELDAARLAARGLLAAGVDALIVQDMAWLRMGLTAHDDGVEFHASTQTTNIDPQEIAFLARAGFRRVILERALSLDEIRTIRAATQPDTELETFVHGAICVSHSGRCFMSRADHPSFAGGESPSRGATRSGNRGDCAQPCRLAWDLVDASGRTVIRNKHLLSVRDLDLGARLGELLDAGVTSFKIEGRLKDATYVRNVVSHYRRLLDREIALRPGLKRASLGTSTPDFTPDPAKSFTRDASEYFIDGPAPGVASFDTPKAMGESIGRVDRTGCDRTGNRWFTLTTDAALSPGDGICWLSPGGGNTPGELRGTNINRTELPRVYPNRAEGLIPGTELFRNHDHAFVRTLERSRQRRRIAVEAVVRADKDRIGIVFTDETGLTVSVERPGPFETARDPARVAATLREQLTRTGDTIFTVADLNVLSAEPALEVPATRKSANERPAAVPVSTITAMRREGLEALLEARRNLPPDRHPAHEDPTAKAPRPHLTITDNVTNHLAARFWSDHGVTTIDPALELHGPAPGDPVMQTRYCLRREIGECLREGSKLQGNLCLVRGATRWSLDFDCTQCHMIVKKI